MLVLGSDRPLDPPLEASVSDALVQQVARGEHEEALRFYRPAPTVAFGRVDARADGFAPAAAATRARGFAPIVRAPGGRPAAYDEGSVLFDLVVRSDDVLHAREDFVRTSDALATALAGLGLDARVGAVPGEYCPGDYSINIAGRAKIVGIAQRRIRGATLVSGFVTVDGADRLRAVLVDVYAALGIDWEPATVAAVADLEPDVDAAAVEAAVGAALAPGAEGPARPVADTTLALARTLVDRHTA